MQLISLKKLFSLFNWKKISDSERKAAPPATFNEELNRWCNTSALPIVLLACVSWPIYIPLDIDLYGHAPIIIALRWGFTLDGLICLGLLCTKWGRKNGYILILMIEWYLALATGLILGLVAADPVYMGGFSIVVVTMALLPIQRIHALLMLLSSLLIFEIVGTGHHMKFVQSVETYGLYNLLVAVAVAIIAIFVFDKVRENSYNNSRAYWMANAELKKANELKNQLLQIAAHDLKDPLQVIIGYSDLLKMRLSGDRFATEKLKIVNRSADRMIKLIAGLLEITDIESGKLVLHKNQVDLGTIVAASVKSFQPDSLKKNQKLLYAPAEDCVIDGDEMLLRQVANHLISNAIKFSPPGKNIWVTLNRSQAGNWATLKVQDEGPGLQINEMERVFNKFQQLSNKPTGGEISTGLGLAITRDLVSLHEGSITVESEPDKGCIFVVTLPLIPPSSEPV